MDRILIESAFRAVMLAVATAVLLRVLRIRTSSGRHAAWTVTVVAMLSLPLWISWGPKARVPMDSSRTIRMWMPKESTRITIDDSSVRTAKPAALDVAATGVASGGRTLSWRGVLWAVYALGAVLLLARLAIGTWRTRQLVRRAFLRRGRLTSAACAAPITVGLFRPVAILPDGWEKWPAEQLKAVLVHEQEHARRHDPLVQWLALLNRAVFWFHPVAWWLERRLAILAEEACDSAVLSRGHAPARYAEYLLSLARFVMDSGARMRVVGTAMPGVALSSRIRRILTAAPELPTSSKRLLFTLLVCAITSTMIAATTVAPSATRSLSRVGAGQSQATSGTRLPEYWFDDDEWHLEVASIITRNELEKYKALGTVTGRDAFIAEFWRRRDETPVTAANEFRQEFERRIAYAKEHFENPESAATFGYQTDRGRWYVSFGPPDAINGAPESSEEWRYRSLPALGSNVIVRFDPMAELACSYRGGRYRIVSPAPLRRFGRRDGQAMALAYPDRFVYIAFPIDADAVAIRWGLRARSGVETAYGEAHVGTFDYVQGMLGSVDDAAARQRPLLDHLKTLRFFEPAGFACTEQLPPDVYTLTVESRLVNDRKRTDTLVFEVE